MLIGDKYKIEADSLNITLYQAGKNYWRPIAYFSTVENALIHMADLELASTELKDFRSVVAKQNEIYQLIQGLGNSSQALQRVTGAKK